MPDINVLFYVITLFALEKTSMLYYGEYSLQCKPSLFSSDIYQISYNGCYNVIEIYGIFVWNFSNRFQNFMLG